MGLITGLHKKGLEKAVEYILKDPEKNLDNLFGWAESFFEGSVSPYKNILPKALEEQDNIYRRTIIRCLKNTDIEILKMLVGNFIINEHKVGEKKRQSVLKKYGYMPPFVMMMDLGDMVQEKGSNVEDKTGKKRLSFYEIDSLVKQGKDVGIFVYVFLGEKSLSRISDVSRICNKHKDCVFLCMMDMALVSKVFTDKNIDSKNIVPIIYMYDTDRENYSFENDLKNIEFSEAMLILHNKKIPFGILCKGKEDSINGFLSEKKYDFFIAGGAFFILYIGSKGRNISEDVSREVETEESVFFAFDGLNRNKPIFTADFGKSISDKNDNKCICIRSDGSVGMSAFSNDTIFNIREKNFNEGLGLLTLNYR